MSIPIASDCTPTEAAERIANAWEHDRLAEAVVNDALNRLIASDGGGLWEEGGPIPFAGWYWRGVEFFRSHGVTIAHTEDGVRVCENNKWGYDQRCLTDDEQATFRDLVWAGWVESRKGGNLAEIQRATRAALEKAGEFIASLAVSR